jgi:hypothetical protein
LGPLNSIKLCHVPSVFAWNRWDVVSQFDPVLPRTHIKSTKLALDDDSYHLWRISYELAVLLRILLEKTDMIPFGNPVLAAKRYSGAPGLVVPIPTVPFAVQHNVFGVPKN